MKRNEKKNLFHALTGLVQVVTLILFVHCLQAVLGLLVKILSLFLLSPRPAVLI